MSLADRPAFPPPRSYGGGYPEQTGMTYRQWLVGMSLQGCIVNSNGDRMFTVEEAAVEAVKYADAAIAIQEK